MRATLITFLLVCLTMAGCSRNTGQPEEATHDVSDINDYPQIVLRLSDGQEIEARQLTGNNVFVMFFPDCGHCQEEAVHIEERLDDFGDYTLYFISSAPMEQIVDFGKNANLYGRENVKFAWTAPEGVLNTYGPIRTPSIYIYSDKRLKTFFNGQTDIRNILGAL